jgi:catechol 2,3-dioxygenase-like lactoylglutathione lyase family enzyme
VLLIFDPGQAEQPGRPVPSHGSRGPGHVALRIDADAYDAWLGRLRIAKIPVEHEHDWDGRGRSIYIRDPAGNSVELITADIWPP